jgi:hypothetical protein
VNRAKEFLGFTETREFPVEICYYQLVYHEISTYSSTLSETYRKPEGNRPLGRTRHTRTWDNININTKMA